MTDAADATAAMPIDIVSDVVCPWCFIGKRKLEQARGAGVEDAPAPGE